MRIITLLVASLILSASLCLAGGPVNLSSPEAKALLAKNSRVLLLDVRTPDEYRQAHLRGALLIPLDELERRLPEIPRDRPLLVYCAVGARSLTAARLLAAKGFREVYQLSDGLVGWYKNGYPVERAR
jgi:rhodanese-related sulfurtransferase